MVSGLEYGDALDTEKLWRWLGGDPRASIPAATKAKKTAGAGPGAKRGRKAPLSANGKEASNPAETADPSDPRAGSSDPSGPLSAAAEDPSADLSGPCQMDLGPDDAVDRSGNKAASGEAKEDLKGISDPGVSGQEGPSELAAGDDVVRAEADEAAGADEGPSGAALEARSSPAPAASKSSGSGAVNLKPFPPELFQRQPHHILDRKT